MTIFISLLEDKKLEDLPDVKTEVTPDVDVGR